MTRLSRILLLCSLAVAPAVAIGCGGDKAAGKGIVKGKLVENGKPFALDASRVPLPKGGTGVPPGITGSALQVVFIAASGGEQFIAETNPDAGTFEVKGPDGKGIVPGRYKIAVTGRYSFGAESPDYFKGMFTPEKTQILRDVKPEVEVEIDVAKPQG